MDFSAIGIESNFATLDWVIVICYVSFMIVVGLVAKRYITNMSDFVVAGRSLKSYLGIATLVGTEFGLVNIVCASQKGFTGGFSAIHLGLIGFVVTIIIGLTGVVLVPLRRAGIMTIPEYYERRFGRGVRIFGGLIMLVSGVIGMGLFMKAGVIFIMGLTGLASEFHLKLFMTAMIILVVFYTTLGGMVSVIIADYIQFIVMTFSLLLVCVLSVHHLGWDNIVATVSSVRGESGFNPFHEEGFGFVYVIYMVFVAFTSCATWQTTVIRTCAAKDESTVKRMITCSSVGFMARMMIPILLGICAFVFVSGNEALSGIFLPKGGPADSETTMMATPVFLSWLLPTGLIGLVMAGMLAAFLSTHDSYILCWAAVFVQDVVAPCMKNEQLSTKARLRLTRLFILFEAIFILIWGLWYPIGQDLWDYMVISGAIYFVGANPLLILGLYWKGASKVGAYLALAMGFVAFLGLKPIQAKLGFDVSSAVIGSIVVILAFFVMFVSSLLWPDKSRSLGERSTV